MIFKEIMIGSNSLLLNSKQDEFSPFGFEVHGHTCAFVKVSRYGNSKISASPSVRSPNITGNSFLLRGLLGLISFLAKRSVPSADYYLRRY